LLDGIDLLISGKGKKAVTVDLRKEKPGWAELSRLMLGPTGNLRAPVIRKGKTLIIGFHVETYEEQLT
jgi:arsenate reductase-like glutaredoxin family protein